MVPYIIPTFHEANNVHMQFVEMRRRFRGRVMRFRAFIHVWLHRHCYRHVYLGTNGRIWFALYAEQQER